MGILDFLKTPDINQGVLDHRNTPGALLLDVRSPGEYREGHIPGSQNIPLQAIDNAHSIAENKDTVLYLYCHSGSRSRQATAMLRHMGYRNVHNIGGIAGYSGKLERQR